MKNKKPIVIYLDNKAAEAVDELAKRTHRTKTAAGELLVRAGLIALDLPISAILGGSPG